MVTLLGEGQGGNFVYFWPIKGVELTSLWAAAAGDRPWPMRTAIPATSPGTGKTPTWRAEVVLR